MLSLAHKNSTIRRLSRAEKARKLFETGHVHPAGDGHRYYVDAEGGFSQYRVEFAPNGAVACNCPDWQRQYERIGEPTTLCKHSQATAIYKRAIRESWRPHKGAA